MSIDPKIRTALSSTIKALRTGTKNKEGQIKRKGLIDLFGESIRKHYGWTKVDLSKEDWTVSYENEDHLDRFTSYQRERLKEYIQTKIIEKGLSKYKNELFQSQGEILKDIATEAAYTLLHQHVFVRITEFGDIGVSVQNEDLDWDEDSWEDYDEESSEEEEHHSDEEEEQTHPLKDAFSNQVYGKIIEHSHGALTADIVKADVLNAYFDQYSVLFSGLFAWDDVLEFVPRTIEVHKLLIEALGREKIQSCWNDPLTFGWIYQFWNDPRREGIDQAIKNKRHKIQRDEISSKTQLFSDRYIVDFMLQNTILPFWLKICEKNGWEANVFKANILENIQEKRELHLNQWNETWKDEIWDYKESEELEQLLLSLDEEEQDWVFFQTDGINLQEDTGIISSRLSELRILEPACGSGHFLVMALRMLFKLYQEEALHLGNKWTSEEQSKAIYSIINNNLHGIDIDPRAVQITTCTLFLQAKLLSPSLLQQNEGLHFNLVSSDIQLANIPRENAKLQAIKEAIFQKLHVPAETTQNILHLFRNIDYLGSLKRITSDIQRELTPYKMFFEGSDEKSFLEIFYDKLEQFLNEYNEDNHNDLGLSSIGHQLNQVIRFLRINREDKYHLVIMNPPYQSSGKMDNTICDFQRLYPDGSGDLFTAFILRSMEFLKEGGLSSSVTLNNWMFLGTFYNFRTNMLLNSHLSMVVELGKGAFQNGSNLINSSINFFEKRTVLENETSLGIRPYPPEVVKADNNQIVRIEASLQNWAERFNFDVHTLRPLNGKGIEGWPLIYWWDETFLQSYERSPKVGNSFAVKKGIDTGINSRYTRKPWELPSFNYSSKHENWSPYVMGAEGDCWFEPLKNLVLWKNQGLSIQFRASVSSGTTIRNPKYFKKRGIAYSTIGSFSKFRVHRFPSICDNGGTSLYPPKQATISCLCILNSSINRTILQELNPTVNFQAGDVNRLPLFPIESADEIYAQLDQAFTEHESHREPSVEFKEPGQSCWNYAQDWAQISVDRAEGEPLPDYNPTYDIEPDTDHISYQLGVALGRFNADGSGILDPSTDDCPQALPGGFLLLDGTLDQHDLESDGLGKEACQGLRDEWQTRGSNIDSKKSLRDYLRLDFFKNVHNKMYEKRPIHWPLSSKKKTFVVWVNIHRMNHNTFTDILTYLNRSKTHLEQNIEDVDTKVNNGDRSFKKRLSLLKKALPELETFIADLNQCISKGPENTNPNANKVDAEYHTNLDDGVMINSSALWPVLDPQWKDPKKWWKSLCADGAKNFDWAHLTMRYFPERVKEKCTIDPSLAVAHGCFWKEEAHRSRAWKWELRLQQEIGEDFVIEELDHEQSRATYFEEHSSDAIDLLRAEIIRRNRLLDGDKTEDNIQLNRAGLWTHAPDKMKVLEQEFSTNVLSQASTFRILASDRPTEEE